MKGEIINKNLFSFRQLDYSNNDSFRGKSIFTIYKLIIISKTVLLTT